jgi:hypothetical protein
VVLLDSGDDGFVAAPITSRPRTSNYDVPIDQWREAGLNTASTARVHNLAVLAKEPDRTAVRAALRRGFSLDQ